LQTYTSSSSTSRRTFPPANTRSTSSVDNQGKADLTPARFHLHREMTASPPPFVIDIARDRHVVTS
jgi:hypothetical protein